MNNQFHIEGVKCLACKEETLWSDGDAKVEDVYCRKCGWIAPRLAPKEESP